MSPKVIELPYRNFHFWDFNGPKNMTLCLRQGVALYFLAPLGIFCIVQIIKKAYD